MTSAIYRRSLDSSQKAFRDRPQGCSELRGGGGGDEAEAVLRRRAKGGADPAADDEGADHGATVQTLGGGDGMDLSCES